MSVGRVNNSAAGNRNLTSRTLSSVVTGVPRTTKPWKLNPSWPVITLPDSSQQKIIGLHAVFPGDGSGNGGNFLALTCSGAYTIDYGDGTTTSYVAGVQANYEFNFNSSALAGTNAPVTLVDSGDLIQRTSHGYITGDRVQFYNIVSTTGLTEAAQYYVINANVNDFQVSTAQGGSAVALTTNGTATLLPYKIAIVTLTPQSGQNITAFNLNLRNTSNSAAAYTSGWLDLAVAGPNLTSATLTGVTQQVLPSMLERFRCSTLGTVSTLTYFFYLCNVLGTVELNNIGSVTDMSNMFNGCNSLRTVPLLNTAAVTSMASMFQNCRSLTSVPLLNTAAVTTMASMFTNCYSLTSVPLFNTAAVTIMSSMFNGCYSLTSVPLFNTAAVTTMASMFNACTFLTSVPLLNTAAVNTMATMFANCSSLTSVPLLNTAAVTIMSSMFNGCYSLTSVPLFNTVAVTTMASMFTNCTYLTSVPLFNTAAVTTTASMFTNCYSLTSVPLFNTAAVISMLSMFSSCTSLISIPLFNTAAVTTMASMFSSCTSLTSVPLLNTAALSSSASIASMFSGCTNLSRIQATGFRFTFVVSSCKLSAAALNEIFTNLPTVTAQTITLFNNYGAATCTRSIATAKGWTVIG